MLGTEPAAAPSVQPFADDLLAQLEEDLNSLVISEYVGEYFENQEFIELQFPCSADCETRHLFYLYLILD